MLLASIETMKCSRWLESKYITYNYLHVFTSVYIMTKSVRCFWIIFVKSLLEWGRVDGDSPYRFWAFYRDVIDRMVHFTCLRGRLFGDGEEACPNPTRMIITSYLLLIFKGRFRLWVEGFMVLGLFVRWILFQYFYHESVVSESNGCCVSFWWCG